MTPEGWIGLVVSICTAVAALVKSFNSASKYDLEQMQKVLKLYREENGKLLEKVGFLEQALKNAEDRIERLISYIKEHGLEIPDFD